MLECQYTNINGAQQSPAGIDTGSSPDNYLVQDPVRTSSTALGLDGCIQKHHIWRSREGKVCTTFIVIQSDTNGELLNRHVESDPHKRGGY
jgi:hypothetical protein